MDNKDMPAVRLNRKMHLRAGSAYAVPRVTHRKARGYKSARCKVKCGCCNGSFEIYYGDFDDPGVAILEIAGVNAGVQDWRAILLPLLGFERQGDMWVDRSEE